jgi:hypothetical protein
MNPLVSAAREVRGSARKGAIGHTLSPVESSPGWTDATAWYMPGMRVHPLGDLYRD